MAADRVGDYDFDLPQELIAQQPAEARAGSRSDARLLVLNRRTGTIEYSVFNEFGQMLDDADVVVMNNAAVVPSILHGRDSAGVPVVVNIFSPMDDGTWHCLVLPEPSAVAGTRFSFAGEVSGTLLREESPGVWRIGLTPSSMDALSGVGEIAYPDYLREPPADPNWYQTDFASRPGATLFPSAARHFTRQMLAELKARGVGVVEVTLFIAARWQPGYLARLLARRHADGTGAGAGPLSQPAASLPFPRNERYEVTTTAADEINDRRRGGGRVIVCGTSALRALETVSDPRSGRVWPGTGWTGLTIGPGHQFRACDGFLTNLHMPRSSELRLTSAFTGRERLLDLYRNVIVPGRYLFNEFGDSMFIA